MRTLLAAVPALAVVLGSSPAFAQNDLQPPPPMTPETPGYPGAPQPGYPGQPGAAPPSAGSNADDESEDSGLGLEWVWLRPEVGFSYVDMESLSSGLSPSGIPGQQPSIQKTHGSGYFYGGAIGIRLLFLTVGARLVNQQLSSVGNLWDIGGEAALHMRVWRIDPYFGLRAGYTWVGSLDSSSVQSATGVSPSSDVAIHGFSVGPAAGIDLYFAHLFSIGADASAEVMFLKRPPATPPAGIDPNKLPPNVGALYQQSGSSVGLGTNIGVHVGLHF
jgi:hypothetical protein